MWSGNQWSRRGRESRGGRGGVYCGYGRNTIQPKFISLDDFEQSNPFDIINDSVIQSDGDDEGSSFNSHNSEMTPNSVGQGHYMGGHSSPNNNIERSMEYDDTYSHPANLDDREFPNLSSADPAARTTGDKTYISSTNIVVHGSEPPSPAHEASQPHVESSALNEASGGSEPTPSTSNENGESNLPPNETVSSEHDRVSRTQKRAEDIKKQVERQRSRTSSRRRDSLSSSQKPPPPPGGADKNHHNVKQDASK